jgi:pimeloyl-ACP methyl ester carboxylesterase
VNGKAVIAHGAGSSADFVWRAFAGPLAAVGYDVVSWDRRTPVEAAGEEFANLVAACGATIVGGVSIGATLALRYALTAANLDGALLAMPPPAGAAPTSDPRDEAPVDPVDMDALIDEVCRTAVPWVADEIRAAWPTYEPAALMRELRSAAVATTPAAAELAQCRVPAGVVALADDPVHPVAVASMWARVIPAAALETVQLHEPAGDVSVIGAAAVRAWQRARPD